MGFGDPCKLAEGCRAERWQVSPGGQPLLAPDSGAVQLQELSVQLTLQEPVLSVSVPFLAALPIIFHEIIVTLSKCNS